jgi:hypothetical protein
MSLLVRVIFWKKERGMVEQLALLLHQGRKLV